MAQLPFSCYEVRVTSICRTVCFFYMCYTVEINHRCFNGQRKERVKQINGQF